MSLKENLRKASWWEWVALVSAIIICARLMAGCAGVKAALDPLAEHGTQVGLGTAAGAGAGLLAGASGWGVVIAALTACIVTIFSTPAPAPGGPPPSPAFSLLQYVIFGAILYVLWIRRARIMDGIRAPGLSAKVAHWAHAFLGTPRSWVASVASDEASSPKTKG